MKFNYRFLFSPIFTGVLFIIFALAMAVATFIENDFGAASARQMIYGARWFELIFLLMIINLAGQVFTFRLYQKKKLTILLFHLAFIIMILGAAITRFTGYEGLMHIREGESSQTVTGSEKFMGVKIYNVDGSVEYRSEAKVEVTGSSLGNFYREAKIDGRKYSFRYSKFIPNAVETVNDQPGNMPVVSLLLTSATFREVVSLQPGDLRELPGLKIGFLNDPGLDISISFENDTFRIACKDEMAGRSMVSGDEKSYQPGVPAPLKEMSIYATAGLRIVPQKLSKSAIVVPVVNPDQNQQSTGRDAFEIEISSKGESKKVYVYNIYNGPRTFAETTIDGKRIELYYGPEEIILPFRLKLEDFVLERYPGSSSPSGYKSNVILVDKEKGVEMPYSIFMNNILKYGGYRFYQSSYDRDERGTILSVNGDRAGMTVTYLGYGLLFLFIILTMINPSSMLRKSTPSMWRNNGKKLLSVVVLGLLIPAALMANPGKVVYEKGKADEFGKVLVQDQKGRTKPLYTVSNDILRKINRSNSYANYSPMQVFLGFSTDFQNWQDEKIIKVSNKDLRVMLGITGDYASIDQIVNFGNNVYKLSSHIDKVFSKPQSERTKLDKEILKVDERVNIIMMMARGEFLKMFPLRDGTDHWGLPGEALPNALHEQDSTYLSNILSLYTSALFEGKSTGNYSQADQYLDSIIEYQRRFASYELPSEGKVKAELFYYKSLIFEKLFPFYATTGLVMIIILVYLIIAGKSDRNFIIRALSVLVLAGFLFHTLGLGVRWYISGHSPMSNGYESLLFISWVTVLAGLIFSRRSYLTLAATSVLAALTLMVAHLSFMDPEITALVPVLQSYWLTLHVSVITGSYGFFGLSAILGLVSLILYSMTGNRNKKHILLTIDDLTVINFRSMTLGLYFLTIGTFLGAVWANESWGRYWGWDPKETWSLITMIIYAFVLHSRMIKGLNSVFTFNVMALFGFSSVLMTYFGVNYYLSGLHSYAGGDPVPVPSFVYVTIILLVAVTLVAYRSYRKIFPAGVSND